MNTPMPSDVAPMAARRPESGLLAVLVVYRRALEDVPAWKQLQHWIAQPADTRRMHVAHVLIYDNSPSPTAVVPSNPAGVTVVHDAANGGTRAAYARALALARAEGLRWLLLLDHDTSLPADFLARLDKAIQRATTPAPAAWLPRIVSHGEQISPACIRSTGLVRPMPLGTGSCDVASFSGGLVTGIASGSVLAVEAMASVPAPPPTMWLDGIDHWYFLQLQHHGYSIGHFDAELAHELSVMDYSGLSAARAASILSANRELLTVLPWQADVVYPARVLWFLLKLGRRNPAAARTLFGHLLRGALRHA